MKDSTIQSKIGFFSSGILFIFLGWIVFSSIMNNPIYPDILSIFKSFFTLIIDIDVLLSMGVTLLRVLAVILISLILSLGISYLYILFEDSIYFFKPLMTLIRATPLAVISVYLWISLGSDLAPFMITLLMVFPVMSEGFISAIDNIDNAYKLQLKTEDIPLFTKFIKVYIPLIFPYIIMTVLQTFGLGIKVMIMGEYICQTSLSMGNLIYSYKQSFSFDNLIALGLYIVIIVCVLEITIKNFSKPSKKA